MKLLLGLLLLLGLAFAVGCDTMPDKDPGYFVRAGSTVQTCGAAQLPRA